MEKTVSENKSPFAVEPVGRLLAKFAIPCVISLLVNSLYNIVDQIFIGWGVGYIGNGATNVVFPITIVALALALMIGDGGAAYLSLKLGEGDVENARRGVGNALTLVTIVSLVLAAVFLTFIEPILTLFGATEALMPYALEYGWVIGAGLPFMMIPAALNSIIRADGGPKYAMFSMALGAVINTVFDPIFIFCFGMGVRGAAIATVMGQVASFLVSAVYLPRFKTLKLYVDAFRLRLRTCRNLVGISVGAQPIIGFNYGAKNFMRVKKALDMALLVSEIIAVAAFLIFQFAPMSVVRLFGAEEGLYNEFAVLAFRIFLLLCPLTGFQTVVAVYLQAVGKPGKSTLLSLARQIIFFVPAALLLPRFWGVVGVLWTGPVADGLAFLLSLGLYLYERRDLHRIEHLKGESAQ